MHDKALLSINYALVKFRMDHLGTEPFVVYTDHASLPTAINTPRLFLGCPGGSHFSQKLIF